MKKELLHLYTDGSSTKEGGGFGVVCLETIPAFASLSFYHTNTKAQYCIPFIGYGYTVETTNNREELKGIILAMYIANHFSSYEYKIFTDSSYCFNSITKWASGWRKNGWTKGRGEPVKNLDLIKAAYKLYTETSNITLAWVRGHDGNLGNELADSLCTRNKAKYNTLIKQNQVDELTDFEIPNFHITDFSFNIETP